MWYNGELDLAIIITTRVDNTLRAWVGPKGLLCREVRLNSVPARRQFAIIQIKLTFSPQTALVRNSPVFGPEGSALHAKRTKDWSKTGPRTDFVTSSDGRMHGHLVWVFKPLYTIPPSGQQGMLVRTSGFLAPLAWSDGVLSVIFEILGNFRIGISGIPCNKPPLFSDVAKQGDLL